MRQTLRPSPALPPDLACCECRHPVRADEPWCQRCGEPRQAPPGLRSLPFIAIPPVVRGGTIVFPDEGSVLIEQ